MAIPSGRRRIRRALAGGATTAVLVGLLTTPGTAFAATPTPDQRVGRVPTAPADAAKTDAPADSTPLNLSVTLNPRDQGALTSFIAAVSDPKSPQYRKYLKTGEFGQVFGADKATVDATLKALTDAGLHPGPLDANGLTIPVATTVGEAKKAFATDFAGYRLADGTTAFANTAAPKLSGRIAGQVLAVAGLDSLVKAKPHLAGESRRSAAAAKTGASVSSPRFSNSAPTTCTGARDMMTQQGDTYGVDYLTPELLAPVYQKSLVNGGAGSTVAIFSLEEFNDDAVKLWQNCFGTSASVSRVPVNGGPTIKPAANNAVGGETALDIEAIAGMAPNAEILVYQGPDWQRATLADEAATYQKIVSDNRAQVVSISWGQCELDMDPGLRAAEHVTFQQAAAQGQSVVAASGDSGAAGCYHAADGPDGRLSVDYPSSDPYVTAVGGTHIDNPFGTASETVWNTSTGAGGGGVARTYPLDSATGFQAGLTGAGYSNVCSAAAGQACRQVPDVAALADPTQGYLVFDFLDTQNIYFSRVGGTSLSAPLWAAFMAHVNADAQCASSGPIGYLNPQLYKLKGGNGYYDVTSGNIDLLKSGYTGGLYAAGQGYDMATGLGTPRVDQLTAQLCAQQPESPAGTFSSMAPARFLDTRTDHALGARTERSLQITGVSGIPATGVTSVVLNVTVTDPTDDGHLIVYPSGAARPTTSSLNWQRGKTVPNLVTVPVGKDGKVVFFNAAWGGIQLIADVEGYYTTATDGAKFQASGPTRVLDTRSSGGPVAGYSEKVLTKAQLGAPAGAKAVVANVTVTDTRSEGHLTVYPSGVSRPTTSNLNWVAGQTVPNQVIVPLGTDGSIRLYNAADPSNVIVDVFGFLGTDGGSFHSTTPHRLMDTRVGLGTLQGPLSGRTVRNLPLDFGGKLSGAKAVVLNVTVTEPQDFGHLSLYPYGQTSSTSNLNFVPGQTVANMVTVPVGAGGTVEILNGSWSNVQVIVDVFGYYS